MRSSGNLAGSDRSPRILIDPNGFHPLKYRPRKRGGLRSGRSGRLLAQPRPAGAPGDVRGPPGRSAAQVWNARHFVKFTQKRKKRLEEDELSPERHSQRAATLQLAFERRVATRSTPMIVQVEEKSEHQKLKDPAEAPGLFSHRNHLQVGSVCCGLQMDSPARMI
ncbi:hypothetical protein MHYP_G00193060 [Metynnis hypsauchen]